MHRIGRERPHRAAKSRPRSLRASGVTPAFCCWETQLVFWPRVCDEPKSLSDTKSDNLYAERRRVLATSESTTQTTQVSNHPIRVEEDVKLKLDKYAEFIDSSPAYIVTEALKLLFKKDEEFKSWLGQHTNNRNLNQIEGGSLTEIAKKA